MLYTTVFPVQIRVTIFIMHVTPVGGKSTFCIASHAFIIIMIATLLCAVLQTTSTLLCNCMTESCTKFNMYLQSLLRWNYRYRNTRIASTEKVRKHKHTLITTKQYRTAFSFKVLLE